VTEKRLDLFAVNTGFDFSLKENTSMLHDGISKKGYQYTQSQRKKAEVAVTLLSLLDLEAKVSAFHTTF
jgi:hypothetical protein